MRSVVPFEYEEPSGCRDCRERIIGLRGRVDADGLAATFTIQYEGRQPSEVLVTFAEMPVLMHEVRAAAVVMCERLAHQLDGGTSAMLDIWQHPLHPSHLSGYIDKSSGDHVYCFQFPDHAPLAIRMTVAEALQLRASIDKARINRLSN